MDDDRDGRAITKFFTRFKIHGVDSKNPNKTYPQPFDGRDTWYVCDGHWSKGKFVVGPLATSHLATIARLKYMLRYMHDIPGDEARNEKLIVDFIMRYNIVGRPAKTRKGRDWWLWDRTDRANRWVDGPHETTEAAAIARIKFLLKILRESNQ